MQLLDIINIEITLLLLFFVVASLLFLIIISWLYGGLSDAQRRVNEAALDEHHVGEVYHEQGFSVRWLEPIANLVLPPDNWRHSHMKSRLIMAGYRSLSAQHVFLTAKIAGAIIPAFVIVLPLILAGYLAAGQQQALLVFFACATLGFFIPDIFLFHKREQRQQALAEAFPDALDLLVVCVEAGLGLDAAIQRVAREIRVSHPMLSDELGLVSLELRAGKARNEALSGLADRSGLSDIKSLSSILIQAENFGTSVAAALSEHAGEMRTVRLQRAKERAAKLPVKMTFPILLFIFPSIFLVILGPAVIRIFTALVN